MRAKVAVATVSGKAYFLLTRELREQNIQFVSVVPGETLPVEVKVAITTEKERALVVSDRTLIYNPDMEPRDIVNEAARILRGKESYDKIVIGIDPGEVVGFAAIADGKIIETKDCLNVNEVLNETMNLIMDTSNELTSVTIKIGNGVPAHRNLLKILDSELPQHVILEVVGEAGTNRRSVAHRRGLRDIASAIQIAGRVGHVQPRQNTYERSL